MNARPGTAMIKPLALAFGLLAFAAPAFAQKDDLKGIDDAYGSRAQACLDANAAVKTGGMTQEARLSACQANLQETDSYYAGRTNPGKHENNMYRMHRGFLVLEIGGAYTGIDKKRTARVCSQTEGAWAELAKIVDAESPAAYQTDYVAMRNGIRPAVEICRREFGAPSGAPPLPPQ